MQIVLAKHDDGLHAPYSMFLCYLLEPFSARLWDYLLK